MQVDHAAPLCCAHSLRALVREHKEARRRVDAVQLHQGAAPYEMALAVGCDHVTRVDRVPLAGRHVEPPGASYGGRPAIRADMARRSCTGIAAPAISCSR